MAIQLVDLDGALFGIPTIFHLGAIDNCDQARMAWRHIEECRQIAEEPE